MNKEKERALTRSEMKIIKNNNEVSAPKKNEKPEQIYPQPPDITKNKKAQASITTKKQEEQIEEEDYTPPNIIRFNSSKNR